jgi:50S ribosomal protein L16 3-hydroxylase
MILNAPQSLLGGMSPATFMRRHWHKKPLVVRQAIPGLQPLLARGELLALASQEDVESRLVVQAQTGGKSSWRFRHGPFTRKQLPPFKQRLWTLLVQGVNVHDDRVSGLMESFRFVPAARLDDLMISFATDGGGVGPHFDSYDVFLLQVQGQRRWRIGRQKDLTLVPEMPLKILADFKPEQEYVLNPGDMLYLPPRYAHDGIAMGECMTYSIGFRSPSQGELAQEILQRIAEQATDGVGGTLYRDRDQEAVEDCARVPPGMLEFSRKAVELALKDPQAIARALGEILTEPKAQVWFDSSTFASVSRGVRVDRRTRVLYDDDHFFINGESFRSGGKDAVLMCNLADFGALSAAQVQRLSSGAHALLEEWCLSGWVHELD